jgi:hypothetical protein
MREKTGGVAWSRGWIRDAHPNGDMTIGRASSIITVNSARRNGALGGTDGIEYRMLPALAERQDPHLSRSEVMALAALGAGPFNPASSSFPALSTRLTLKRA